MFPYRRLAPAFKSCLLSVARPVASTSHVMQRRGLISSVPRRAEPPSTTSAEAREQASNEAEDEDNEFRELMTQQRGNESGPASYRQFLEEIGHKYKFSAPQLWLGNKPFPMNPSFKPPPPISDKQRETIYRLYWLNPRQYNIRKLSKIFNISLKRVTAILRLKSLEKNWIKGKELQTGFLFGMERLLEARTHNAVQPIQDTLKHKDLETLNVHDDRSDVHKADLLEQKERRDAVKVDFEQLYWETIPEGSREPILPISLQEAQKSAISKKKRREAKANAKFMHRIPDTEFIKAPTYKVLTLVRKSRPTTRFVNVGSAFMDARELAKRQVVSRRKSRIRTKKSLEKKARLSRGKSII
ncbi:hypothetical protein BYT27DRAFT_7190108 [Phlegmacium glaucopus]|nr:hypothetical protein BYT27DRAFT_7190108 [Phlegmacium glaucopus]